MNMIGVLQQEINKTLKEIQKEYKEINKFVQDINWNKINKEKDSMLNFEIETTKIYDILNNSNLVKNEFGKIIYYEGD